MIPSHEMVVARQSIAVGAGHCDDGLREVFILYHHGMHDMVIGHVPI